MSSNRKVLLMNPEMYVDWWIRRHNIRVYMSGVVVTEHPKFKHYDINGLINQVIINYITEVNAFNAGQQANERVRPLSESVMKAAFENRVVLMAAEMKEEVLDKFKYDPVTNGNNELHRFLAAVMGESEVDEVKIATLRHWIWLLKRKMFDLPVVHHLMLVIYGKKHGTGKSTAVKQLVEPLKHFVLNKSVSDLNDSRETPALANNYVVIFDELAGSAKADIETLKRLITEDTIDFRLMRSHNQSKQRQRCVFIGTSNKPIDQMVRDSTGFRRFYQLNAADKIDWDVLNSIDYTKLIKGINENLPRGYIEPVLEQVYQAQQEWITHDPLELWLEEAGIQLAKSPDENETEGFEWVSSRSLYDKYGMWLSRSGYGEVNIQTFSKKMSNMEPVKRRGANGLQFLIKYTGVQARHLRAAALPKIQMEGK